MSVFVQNEGNHKPICCSNFQTHHHSSKPPPFSSFHSISNFHSKKKINHHVLRSTLHQNNHSSQYNQPVPIFAATGISPSHFEKAVISPLFGKWLINLATETGLLYGGSMTLQKVTIQSCGIYKVHSGCDGQSYWENGSCIVFARGPAVAVLILLESDGKTCAVLTERVSVGKLILELPAGMLADDKGDIVRTAVREVEEETGLYLNLKDVIDLTAFLDESTGNRVFPSPGGCDEEISLFLYRRNVDKEIIKQLQGKETGLRDHDKFIKVHVFRTKIYGE